MGNGGLLNVRCLACQAWSRFYALIEISLDQDGSAAVLMEWTPSNFSLSMIEEDKVHKKRSGVDQFKQMWKFDISIGQPFLLI